MSDTKDMANITNYAHCENNNHNDDRNPVIMGIENDFEQKYFQQSCINDGLKKWDCLLLTRQSRCSRNGRIYGYRQRYSYIDGVFIDYPDDETFWNAKYGKYHYRDRTKEQIFQRFADLYLL
jgi:hypothetical protein